MKIEKNVLYVDNLIIPCNVLDVLNNNLNNEEYSIVDNKLVCFNYNPFIEDFGTVMTMTKELLLSTLQRQQQKAFQEIEENEMIAASLSV